MHQLRSTCRQTMGRLLFIAGGMAIAIASAAQAGSPIAYGSTEIRPPATSRPVPELAKYSPAFRHRYRLAPIFLQPQCQTFQSFKTVVPTRTVVMVPPTSTRLVALPSAAPADPKLISTALPDWYVTTQALRQLPATGTSGGTVFDSVHGVVGVVSVSY